MRSVCTPRRIEGQAPSGSQRSTATRATHPFRSRRPQMNRRGDSPAQSPARSLIRCPGSRDLDREGGRVRSRAASASTHLRWRRRARSRSTSPSVMPRNPWRVEWCTSARYRCPGDDAYQQPGRPVGAMMVPPNRKRVSRSPSHRSPPAVNMTTISPPTRPALSFWPALNQRCQPMKQFHRSQCARCHRSEMSNLATSSPRLAAHRRDSYRAIGPSTRMIASVSLRVRLPRRGR